MRSPRPDLEDCSAEEVLDYAVRAWHPRLAVACSFQKEASVIVDLIKSVEPRARVFTLDTGVLFAETHAVWRKMEERYGEPVEVYRGISLDEQARRHGDELWARDPDACCAIRKVGPLEEALSGVDAWVSGLRRDQSPERASMCKLAWDERHAKYKLNPLADWTERDVWRYIAEHDLPYHELHDRGYASIGCTHCTAPGAGREGRWAGDEKTECGLHVGDGAGPAVSVGEGGAETCTTPSPLRGILGSIEGAAPVVARAASGVDPQPTVVADGHPDRRHGFGVRALPSGLAVDSSWSSRGQRCARPHGQ